MLRVLPFEAAGIADVHWGGAMQAANNRLCRFEWPLDAPLLHLDKGEPECTGRSRRVFLPSSFEACKGFHSAASAGVSECLRYLRMDYRLWILMLTTP
jgi:hypothetical protein